MIQAQMIDNRDVQDIRFVASGEGETCEITIWYVRADCIYDGEIWEIEPPDAERCCRVTAWVNSSVGLIKAHSPKKSFSLDEIMAYLMYEDMQYKGGLEPISNADLSALLAEK